MKVYLIYASIDADEFRSKLQYLVPNRHSFELHDGLYVGLYAWTSKKSLKDEFLEYRDARKYLVKKEDLDQEERSHLDDICHNGKIGRYKFSLSKTTSESDENAMISVMKTKSTEIVCSKQEWIESCTNASENYDEFIETKWKFFDYKLFNDKIIKSLDILCYTTKFDCASDDDERREIAEGQASYNLTVQGHSLLSFSDDNLSLFMQLYHDLLL